MNGITIIWQHRTTRRRINSIASGAVPIKGITGIGTAKNDLFAQRHENALLTTDGRHNEEYSRRSSWWFAEHCRGQLGGINGATQDKG